MIEKKQATWANISANGRSAEELARLDAEVEREAETIRRTADMPSLTSPDGRVAIMAPESMTLGEVARALLSIPAFGAVLTIRHDDRGFIEPPDMGKLRPAEEVAKEMVLVRSDGDIEVRFGESPYGFVGWYGSKESDEYLDCAEALRDELSCFIRRTRADATATAMRAATAFRDAGGSIDEGSEVWSLMRRAVDMTRGVFPASTRGFIDPPDLGRVLEVLEEVATALETRAAKIEGDADAANREARIGRDSYAARGPNVGEIELRAQATGLREAAETLRERIRLLPPGADRGFIQPPDLGKPGDVGFIEPPDMGRPAVSPDAVERLAARFDAADPKWHRLQEEVQRRFSGTDAEPKCDHCIAFDETAARGLSASDVRKRWPRMHGACPKGCGFDGIAYASTAHYIAGDW